MSPPDTPSGRCLSADERAKILAALAPVRPAASAGDCGDEALVDFVAGCAFDRYLLACVRRVRSEAYAARPGDGLVEDLQDILAAVQIAGLADRVGWRPAEPDDPGVGSEAHPLRIALEAACAGVGADASQAWWKSRLLDSPNCTERQSP